MEPMKTSNSPRFGPRENPGRRKHGDGSVFQKPRKRADGTVTFDSIWTLSYYVNGRRVKVSSETTDYDKARKRLEKLMEEAEDTQSVSTKATFGEVIQILKDDYRLNDMTEALYALEKVRMPKLEASFPLNRQARTITENDLVKYQLRRKDEGAAAASINKELAALHRAFVLAKRRGLVATVPAFQRIKENNARSGFFEYEDVVAVQRHLPAHMKAIPEVLYYTGWRREEVLSRRWDDVDFGAGELTLWVGEGKDRKVGRTFPLIPPLKAVLEAQRKVVDGYEAALNTEIPWVFAKPDGQRLKSFKGSWKAACDAAKVKGTPHDFRRTAVRNLELAGVPRKAAMAMVGHKTESIYQRYAIADKRMMKVGADMLSSFFQSEEKRRKRGALKAVK